MAADLGELNRALGRILAKMGVSLGRPPRFRYWKLGSRAFAWTTERDSEGSFWALVYSVNKSKGRWSLRRKMRFARRCKAKQRTQAWYEKAKVLKNSHL